MATQVYRVSRVRTAESSPVARLQALDQDGLELHLEVPTALADRIIAGQVLVVNWSVHILPEPRTPVPAEDVAPTGALTPAVPAVDGRSIDEAFMALMARGRRDTAVPREPLTPSTPTVPQTRGVPNIDDEFNTLLGPAQQKGSTNGR